MANLTITVDDQDLKKARLRALEQGTSVSAVLRQYLAQYAGSASAHEQAAERLLRLAGSQVRPRAAPLDARRAA